MTIVKHELRQGKVSFWVWTISIAFLMAVCICLFPEIKTQMEGFTKFYSSLGVFTAAFGMDKLNFGTLMGYYAIECGNVLGLGGAFFAALCAVSILSKEEKGRTAEFLLAHPVSRTRIVTEKLVAVIIQIVMMNVIIFAVSAGTIVVIKEPVPWKDLSLLHFAYLIMQVELACICFAISAFTRKGGAGIGLGIAAIMYFLNIIANISKSAAFLKYITPFGYCDGADIIPNGRMNAGMTAVGIGISVVCIIAAYVKYLKKDIH